MRRWARLCVVLALAGLGHSGARGESGFVWWEAEDAATSTFPTRSAFSTDTPGDWSTLSGGDWISSAGPATATPPTATYSIELPGEGAGPYHLWVRKYWKHGPFHWRFNDQPWRSVTRDVPLADRYRIRTHVEASWAYAGSVELPAGENTFALRLALQPGEDTTSAFDCFVLSHEPFFPRGNLKPGERHDPAGAVEPGWSVFDPPLDSFEGTALLDLRHLNETEAGVNGPLRRSADGNGILLSDGTPVRFWGVNLGRNQSGMPDENVAHMARRMAKLGVNMARHHSGVWNETTYQLDPDRLDRIQHLVGALKTEGIYTHLSWYFPLWIKDAGAIGLEGYGDKPAGSRKPFAVLFFNDKAQAHYFDLMREFLSAPNPHTGIPLAHDPAVGIIELCNEDSLFFWTFTRKAVPPKQWDLLEEKFAVFLTEKHGSLDAALRRWPDAKHERDDAAAGRAGVYEAWHMTGEAQETLSADEKSRVAEQVEFLAGLQRGFYAEAVRVLRDELGYQGLISASNWHTADARLTDAIERWTYTAADVIDTHGYFNGKHGGDGASYSVQVGHTFENRSALLHPTKPPLRFGSVEGHPQIISELGWTNPNRFRADATLLTAAAAAQQGVDGVFWFFWSDATGVDTVTNKFPVTTPTTAGTFPAAALMFRRGDLPEAPVAVHEALRTADLFNLQGTAAVTEAAYDAFRQTDVPPGAAMAGDVERFDPLTAYVGRVTRSFDDPEAADVQVNLGRAIDRPRKKLTSLDGRFRWDHGRGAIEIDTPRCQAVAGFLKRRPRYELSDLVIDADLDYGQVMAVSLDGEPLAASRRILIQAVTEEKLSGFAHGGGRITALGRPPWLVKNIDATVTLKLTGDPVARVTALDGNGEATPEPVSFEGDGVNQPLRIALPADRLYVVIER